MARGDGRVWQRGGIWWIQYYGPRGGEWQQIRESSHSAKETDARKLVQRRLREVANHKTGVRAFQGPAQERLTVANLLDSLEADYKRRGIKSLRRAINHSKPIREFFGNYRAVAVTPDLVRRYIEQRKAPRRRDDGTEKVLSNAMVNRGLEILSAAFRLALKEDRIARIPHIPHLPETNVRQGFLERADLDRILLHLDPPMNWAALFAFICGWRKSEVRLLRWEWVDRAAKEIRLPDTKNGDPTILPIAGELTDLFDTLWSARQFKTRHGFALSEYVFHVKGKPLGDTGFERRWKQAREKAGLPHLLFHDLRRSAARNLIRAGVSQNVAQKITHHKTDSMFRRYDIVSVDDTRAALLRQSEYSNAHSQAQKTNVVSIQQTKDGDVSGTNNEWVH